MSKFKRKYWKTIFKIIWWIFYLRIGVNLIEGTGWGDTPTRGVMLILYPLTLFHLFSFTKRDEPLIFIPEQYDNFTPSQLWFVMLTIYGSLIAFGLLNLTQLMVLAQYIFY